jgi:DNA-binding response OmpR family regulator
MGGANSPRDEQTPAQPSILVVEDEPRLQRLLGFYLAKEGFKVTTASNGQEAIELYWKHHDTIDLVLMDVRIPSLDGPSVLQVIQEIDKEVVCCFTTGERGYYSDEQLFEKGGAFILHKPFNLGEVVRVLRHLLERKAQLAR